MQAINVEFDHNLPSFGYTIAQGVQVPSTDMNFAPEGQKLPNQDENQYHLRDSLYNCVPNNPVSEPVLFL